MTTTFLESEMMEPDTFMGPRRYKVSYQCGQCGHEFSRTYKVVPKDDPPCPATSCGVEAKLAAQEREIANLKAMLESQHPPAQTGRNVQTKAIDATADIVMTDYGMTNLQDGVRHGETVAQKLPPQQQKAADNYFGPKGGIPVIGPSQQKTMPARQLEAIGRRAIAGAYRGMSVPPTAIMPDATRGQPALRQVGARSNDLYQKPN